jgi:hypothetical protein
VDGQLTRARRQQYTVRRLRLPASTFSKRHILADSGTDPIANAHLQSDVMDSVQASDLIPSGRFVDSRPIRKIRLMRLMFFISSFDVSSSVEIFIDDGDGIQKRNPLFSFAASLRWYKYVHHRDAGAQLQLVGYERLRQQSIEGLG